MDHWKSDDCFQRPAPGFLRIIIPQPECDRQRYDSIRREPDRRQCRFSRRQRQRLWLFLLWYWLSVRRRRAWGQRGKRFFGECQRWHDLWLSNISHHVWQRWRNVSVVFRRRSRWWRDPAQCQRHFAGGRTHLGQRRQWFRFGRRWRLRRQHLVDNRNINWLRFYHGQRREWG